LEEQEFFGEVLLGIKQVIQSHMKDIQVKFQDEFFNLEQEVKKRDDIISKLQNRILELEAEHHGLVGLQVQLPPEQGDMPYRKSGSSGSGSTGSSNELPFMRGDSLDTIFASSPHSDSDAPRQPKTRSRKPRTSPRHRQLRNRPNWDESTDQESFDRKDSPPIGPRPPPGGNGAPAGGSSTGPPPPVPPRRMSATATSTTTAVTMSATTDRIRSPYRDLVISELTGNIVSDSVIVNIEATSSSQSESQSENDQPYGEEEEEEDEQGEARQLMRHRRSRSRETDDDDNDGADEDCDDEAAFGEELEGELEQEEEEEEEEAGNEEEEQEEEEQAEEEEEEEEEEELNHNDWEVRMLAAELKKRESISTDFPAELEGGDGLVRRRSHRKRSDTDTDGSEGTERDAFGRPRASSLDQHNLQRRAAFGRAGRAPTIAGPPSAGPSAPRSRGGIFKALSFDRDKDRL
uniref:Uncharacterized protein n=1 Tax=Anopheles coluzzii TaxID=1518534 RepID=A0A8W7P9M6_ANOCL